MASKLEEFEAALEARGGEEVFFDRLASTEDLEEIAREYGASLRTVNLWRRATPERQEQWSEALEVSAHAFAAEGKRILDDVYRRFTPTKDYRPERLESAVVALATARSTSRMKLAAARNPGAYGDKPQVNVQVNNFSGLHLEALKQKGSMSAVNAPRAAMDMLEPPKGVEIVQNDPRPQSEFPTRDREEL